MTTQNKMQWFIDEYKNNKLNYRLLNTHENFGTIVMPTGYGKSSVVYEDIIHAIDTFDGNNKMVINISCPILKLTQQFVSDLFEIFNGIYSSREDLAFYVNSSDNGNNYNDALSSLDIDVDHFSNINKFFESTTLKIAIVASCHKSLYKFIKASTSFKTAIVINYIDEAHLINIHPNPEDEDITVIDVNKMCMAANKTYAFTATPNADVTAAINAWNNYGKDDCTSYIIHVRPIEAINENVIVAPLIKFINVGENDHINTGILNSIMKNAINGNPNINHKILVTLKSSKELNDLRKELELIGYKVFSTCAKYGFGTNEEICDEDDITKFINDVDTYDGHCFVLHIRQLIQGIDIKSLTDCVLFNTSHGNMDYYRHIIQTIGRILRPYKGERGMKKEDRKKKVGRVYFLVPDNAEDTRSNIEQFTVRYYGFDNITFESYKCKVAGQDSKDELFEDFEYNKKHSSGWDNSTIIELLCNIEKYINEQIAPKIKFELKYGVKKSKIKKELEAESQKILAKYDAFGKEFTSSELLDNKDLLDKILKMFNKFDIQNPLF